METQDFGGERRRGPRVPLSGELTIFVESMGQFLERHGRDISEGGMFLESPAPPPLGTRLRFLIQPAGGMGLLRGLAEVAWRRETDKGLDRPAGMGLRFLSMNPEGQELIRRMVAERAAMAGEAPPPQPQPATPPPEEPFPVEAELASPVPPPAEDVFEETPPKAPAAAGPERAPEEPATLVDVTLSEIGRPFGYDEQQQLPRHWRGRIVAATAIVVIVVLGVLGAWYAGWFGRLQTASPPPPAPSPVARHTVPPPTSTPVTAGRRPESGAPGVGALPAPPPAATPVPTATATPTPQPSPTPTIVPTSLPSMPPARTIRSIRWMATAGGTTVRIVPSGALTSRRVRLVLLDDPPRALVQIRGIRAPYPQPVIQAGSPELVRMRIWLHSELKPPELYIVLDLARPGLHVRMRLRHGTVIVTLTRPRRR